LVVYRDRFYAMGGEGGIINRPGQQTVFGQMESYDPATNTWQSHAAMPIPRHAVAAVTIGDWIYVAGAVPFWGAACNLQCTKHLP
jgi:N-acetylneuraminic acid mutarotase